MGELPKVIINAEAVSAESAILVVTLGGAPIIDNFSQEMFYLLLSERTDYVNGVMAKDKFVSLEIKQDFSYYVRNPYTKNAFLYNKARNV